MRMHVKNIKIKKGDNMKVNFKKNNKGFNLIETLLVVGLIAIASIGVYKLFSKVQEGNSANAEAKNIDLIRAGIKTLYATKTNYVNLDTPLVNRAKITPESMIGSATTITNSFGGQVTIAPATINGNIDKGFSITYEKVPGPICNKLAAGAAAQFDIVTVGSSTIKAFGVNDIDINALTTACIDTGAGVTMVFSAL
jgi:prepilin-type N-terminal cleavage/methylation domain-containing protein